MSLSTRRARFTHHSLLQSGQALVCQISDLISTPISMI